MPLSKAQIDAAVQWWMQAIEEPKFDNLGPTRDAELAGNPTAAFAGNLATMQADQTILERLAKLQPFGDTLRKVLEQDDGQIERSGLHVDYGPDASLSKAASESGMKTGIATFPWKTHMHFRDGGVQASCGYGAPYEELLKRTAGESSM